MTQVNAIVNLDINTGQASAHLRALQTQINAFQSSLNSANMAQGAMGRQNMQALSDMTNASRFFTAETMKMRTAASQLDQTLAKGRGTMGQWLGARFAKDGAAASAAMSLAHRRAAALQTQFVATGAAANGFQSALAIKPMTAFNSTAAATNQRLAIQRAMFTQATTSMINFGKNTQWAGRQLMVGFTVPLTMFGVLAGKTFRELEKEVINFKKVYGDSMTPPEELAQNLAAVRKLSAEFTKYGIAAKDTMALAAQAAAAGNQGAALIDATRESTRLATLGQMEQNEALKTTIALQSAFGLSGKELSKSINFLNMVENQTVVTLQDLAAAIPRVAPVIKGLGGTVEDMSAMLAAMQEGGVSAAQGANALKSGLASLINPSNKAVEALSAVGINIKGIIEANRGDLMGTVKGFANALSTLDKFGQQQSLEKLFGKYQYARLGALFANITKAGSQASRVMDIAGLSAEQMAAKANSELNTISDNVATKFTAAMESFKLAIAPIGELFTKLATPIIGFFTMILDKFNSLPDFAKNFIGLGAVITGVVIPAGTMFLGLLMNLTGTLLKFGHIIGVSFKGLLTGGVKGALAAISQSLQYMSVAEMEAASAATQLASASGAVNSALLAQRGAATAATAPVLELATAYSILATRMAEASAMASVNSPMFVPGQAMAAARTQGPSTGASKRFFLRRSFGGGIPGSGNSDTVPAMLTPGEFVVNKEATAKHLPLLHQINQTKSNSQTQSGRYALGDLVRRFAGISAEHMPIAERIIASNPAKARPLNYIQTIGVEPKLKFTRDSSGIMMDSLMNQRLKESNKGFVSGQEVWAAIEAAGPAATSVLRSQAATFAVSGGGIPRVDAVMDTLKAKLLSQKGSVKDNLFGKLFAESLLETGQQDFAMALAKPYMLDSAMPMAPRNLYDRIIGSGFSAVPDSAELRNILAMPTGGARLQLLRPLVSPGQVVFEQRSGRANIYLNDGQDFFNLGNLKGEIGADAANPFGYKNHMRGVPKNQNLVYAHAGLGEEFARLGLVRHMSDGGGPVFLGQPQSSRETALALGRQAALTRAHEDMTTGRFASMPVTSGKRVGNLNSGHSATFVGANGVYEIDGQKYVVKFHDSTDSALIEARGTHLARELHGLESPNQRLVKMPHPQTGQLMPGVASLWDKRFSKPSGPIPKNLFGTHLAATVFGRNRDTQFDNMYKRFYVDVGAAGMGVDAKGNPSAMTSRMFGIPNVTAREQLGINLLMTKGGAKRWFAESTAGYARSMTGAQYEAMMRAELEKVRTNLPRAMDTLPYATQGEREIYTRQILRDLADLDGVNWHEIHAAHASVQPQVAKPPTPAAVAKAAATKMQKLRTLGRGGFGRFGIPFFNRGGLLKNFELDDSSGTNIYRNRFGNGKGGISTFFGRMQPPTVGHGMMMEQAMFQALKTGGDMSIFTPLFGGKDARSPIPLQQRLASIFEAKGIRANGAANAYTIFDALKLAGYKDVQRIIGANDMGSDSFAKAAKSRGMNSFLMGVDRPDGGVSGTGVRQAAMSGSMEAMRAAGFMGGSPRTAAAIMRSIMLHRNAGGSIYKTGSHPIVPGVGSTDTVPAMLTPGEFVINKRATARNLPLLHALNSGAQHFNGGGLAQGIYGYTSDGRAITSLREAKRLQAQRLLFHNQYQGSKRHSPMSDQLFARRRAELAGPPSRIGSFISSRVAPMVAGMGLAASQSGPRSDVSAYSRPVNTVPSGGLFSTADEIAARNAAQRQAKATAAYNNRMALAQQNYAARMQAAHEARQNNPQYTGGAKAARARGSLWRPGDKTKGAMRGAGGMGMAVTMASMIPMMMEPGSKFLGMDAGTASMAMMGGGTLMSLAPMFAPLAGAVGAAAIPIAAIAAAAGVTLISLKLWRDSVDNAAKQTAEMGANIGGTANALQNMAKILGAETPAQAAKKMQLGFTSDDQTMLEGEWANIFEAPAGKQFIEELKNATSAERFEKLTAYLRSGVASGIMDQKAAQSFAKSIGLMLNDVALGTSAASALRDQGTGTGAYKKIADSRLAAVNADSGVSGILGLAAGQEIDASVAGRAIGASIQVIQDYSNVIALARKEYAAGIIKFEEYNAAISQATAAQQKYTDVITNAVGRSTEEGAARAALDTQLIASGMTPEQVDALTHATDIGIAGSFKPGNVSKYGGGQGIGTKSAYQDQFIEQNAMSRYGKTWDEIKDTKQGADLILEARSTQTLATEQDRDQLNEKIKASVLAGEMTAEQGVQFAQQLMYSTEGLKALADGASIATTAFVMSANSLEGVSKSQFKSVGASFMGQGGDIAALQGYLGSQSVENRQAALDRFGNLGVGQMGARKGRMTVDPVEQARQRTEYLNNYGSMSSTIGGDLANTVQASDAYKSALGTDGGGTNIAKAMADAKTGGVTEEVLKYVVKTEGANSPEDLIDLTEKMTENTKEIMGLPDEVIKGLKIDTNNPDDVKNFGTMAKKIKDNWSIIQNLNPNIDLTAAMEFLTMNNGEALTATETAANVMKLNKAWKALGSKDESVRKQAMMDIAIAYAGETQAGGDPAKVAEEALRRLKHDFKNFDKWTPEAQHIAIQTYVTSDVAGLEEAIMIENLKEELVGATGADATRIMMAIQSLMKKQAAARKTAKANVSSQDHSAGGSSSSGGGGGGGGEKKLNIGQELKKQLKELTKTFEALKDLGVSQTEKVKGFIAGPFAPQFIEYLKSQGEAGIKMLKNKGEKFQKAYADFIKIQHQTAKNYMQTLPASILQQRQTAQGSEKLRRRLMNMGVEGDSANSIIEGLPEGEMAAYQQAMAKKKAGKKLTDEEKEMIQRYSPKGLRRIARQQGRLDSENFRRAADDQVGTAARDAKVITRLQGMGYGEEMVSALSQLPGIWQMGNKEIAAYAASLKDTLSLDLRNQANTALDTQLRDAETLAKLRGMGYTDNMVEQLSQLPGIWDMTNAEIKDYAKQLQHIMSLDPAARAQELRDVTMQINDLNREIATIDRVDPLQKELDNLSLINEAYSRKIDLKTRELEKFDDAMDKIEEERDAINKAYDERVKALEKVENVNQRIAQQQQAQLNIASALSRGDVAAAAEAMLQAQQQQAQDRLQDTKDAIEQGRENELLVKENAINGLKEQRKVIEDAIKALQAEQLVNQDLMYDKQLKLNVITAELAAAYDNSALRRQQLIADLDKAIARQNELNRITRDVQAQAQAVADAAANNSKSVAMQSNPQYIRSISSTPAGQPGFINIGGGRQYNPVTQMYRSFGGWIPGAGNSDVTRLMATPGEFMVNKPMAAKYGPLLEAINSNAFPRMNFGSLMPKVDAGMSGVQYNYGDLHFTINGADADVNELADAVIYRIQRVGDRQIKGVKI